MAGSAATAAQRRRTSRLWLALAAVLVLVAASFALGAFITDQLTRPVRSVDEDVTPAALGGNFERLTLRSADDRADLDAWLLPVPGSDVGVVLVHGKDGSKSNTWGDGFVRLALDLQAAGYQVLMLDLRGHGASGDGRYAFGFMERFDVIAGVEHLVEEANVAPGSVGLFGVSMGGASAIYAAALDPRVGAVWSDAAYADVWPIIEQEWPDASGLPMFVLPLVRWTHRLLHGFDLQGVRPVDQVAMLDGLPLMIVHGRSDRLVPVGQAQVLASAAPWAGVWLLEGVGHAGAFDHDPAAYTLRAIEFFDEALRVRLARGW
ncbi:MAG: alpha/beta fold hydrolase [Trueperaceae bacterium]|nr:MAG: alpha/beta fold hydrolase [Trueperaceae bacterium]